MHYYMLVVLTVSWAFWLWDVYLDFRQYRVYQKTVRVPDALKTQIDDETFAKSKAYSIDKARMGFISSLYNQIQSTAILCCYLMPYFWNLSGSIMKDSFGFTKTGTLEWEIFQSLIFTFTTSFVTNLVNLPLSIYNTFVIEERHGFNKQTAGFYAWDKLKMFAVSQLISSPVLATIIFIVRNGGPYFFLYLWMFLFVVVLLLISFQGEIAAIFDKFTPLPKGELRDRIETLAKEINFPLTNIFVVEGSKRSSHSNAYQSGIFKKKRVVIYDTLIEGYNDKKEKEESADGEASSKKSTEKTKESEGKVKQGCNDDEIIAVLCHELGHWARGHLIKHLTFAEINYFLIFVLFSKLYNDPTLYSSFGFGDQQPVIIGFAIFMMILTPYSELQGFIATLLSRKFEYEADNYSKKRGHAEQLKSALIKLQVNNLGFPVHDELYSTFNHSHPTLLQRLNALSKTD